MAQRRECFRNLEDDFDGGSEDDSSSGEPNREFSVGAHVVVNEKAPGGYVTVLGTVMEIVLGSRYGVLDNQKQLTIYLDSECLDPAPQLRRSIKPA
jgi:hypothetical protein